MPKSRLDHPALAPAFRWCADMLCLWNLCGKPACRRRRTCSGAPRECLARYAPLVPQDAREGVKQMLNGLQLQLGYDEVREDAPDEVAAVEDWNARALASASRRRW
jgi:hypothetical protein